MANFFDNKLKLYRDCFVPSSFKHLYVCFQFSRPKNIQDKMFRPKTVQFRIVPWEQKRTSSALSTSLKSS